MREFIDEGVEYLGDVSDLSRLGSILLEDVSYQTDNSKMELGLVSNMSYDDFKPFISKVYNKLLQDRAYVTNLELKYFTPIYLSGGFYYPKISKGWCLYYDGVSNLYEQDINLFHEDSTLVLNSFNILDKDFIIEKSTSHVDKDFLETLLFAGCDYHLALLSYCYCLDTSYKYNKSVVRINKSRLDCYKSEDVGISNYINFDYIVKFAILDNKSIRFENIDLGVEKTRILDDIFYNTKSYIRFDMGYSLKFNVYFLNDTMYATYLNKGSVIHVEEYKITEEVLYLPYFVGVFLDLNKKVNNVDITDYDVDKLFSGLRVSLNSRNRRK